MNPDVHYEALIEAAGRGDRAALDGLLPDLYDQLHELAAFQMRKERPGHLLQTTAILHEAYFRLSKQERSSWRDMPSFLAAASVMMRRVLVDNARKERAAKRGGSVRRDRLADSKLALLEATPASNCASIEIHEALEKLSTFAADQARALEMMFFGGMTGEQVAQALGVSPSTIDRRIRAAKAWLRRELSD